MNDSNDSTRPRKSIDHWGETRIDPGDSVDVMLSVSESYSSMDVQIPIHIQRANRDGPVVFVTAAMHGDEINGTGAVRELIQDDDFQLLCGAVILVPVLNILAFDRHSRYLPDRRDLNRSFPGTKSGSLASRMAQTVFDELVTRCDYGIDLHTASIRRTNYPNVRGDLNDPVVRRLAESFGCEIIIDNLGPRGSFRRECCIAGCPTIIMEGGEIWKVEPSIVQSAVRGVKNVLRSLDMLEGDYDRPDHQVIVQTSKWIRADHGGFLQFHIKPGDVIEEGQPLATNTTLLGNETNVINSPFNAVVVGMTTLPAVSPGEPICNLGRLPKSTNPRMLTRLRAKAGGLEEQISDELGSNVLVFDPNFNDRP
jgi:predicted deacylase